MIGIPYRVDIILVMNSASVKHYWGWHASLQTSMNEESNSLFIAHTHSRTHTHAQLHFISYISNNIFNLNMLDSITMQPYVIMYTV